jgi:hypothetical protein
MNKILTIKTTSLCNKKCCYCGQKLSDHGTKEDIKLNLLKLLNKYDLNNYNIIKVMGGELGVIDKEKLDILFNNLKNVFDKIHIYTNGLFLDKYYNYYKEYNFKYIYHVTSFDNFVDYSNYNKNINLFHNYVVYNYECLDDLEKLLKKYPNYKFDYILDVYMLNLHDDIYLKSKYLFETYKNLVFDEDSILFNNLKEKIVETKKKFITLNRIVSKRIKLINAHKEVIHIY